MSVLKSGVGRPLARPQKAAFLASAIIIALAASYIYLPRTAQSAWLNTSWQYRVAITVSAAQVDADLNNFPVYVDLSDLPADFHTNVRSDGGDIRVTASDGTTEVPRELVSYDAATDTGELHFKALTLSNTTDTVFYLYYGNAAATDYAATDTYGAEGVWTNGYEAVYHLGEASGTMDNSTANAISGVVSIGVSRGVAAKLSEGVQFTANTANINFGETFDGYADLTVSIWIKPQTLGEDDSVFRKTNGYEIILDTDGGVGRVSGDYWWAVQNGAGDWGVNNVSTDIPLNSWHYFALVSDQTVNNEIRISLDDAVDVTNAGTGNIQSNSSVLKIGYEGFGQAFDGYADEFRISSIARSATWLSTEYHNQFSPATFYTIGASESAPDEDPPTPDPMTFAVVPAAASDTSVSMIATTATDDSGSVEYYFAYTACATDAGTGGTDSGWQGSATYTDTGLQAGKCYGYRVKARDASSNETSYSATAEATTTVAEPASGLDTHSGSLAAVYSTRQALTAYEGPLIRVRRSSDSAEVDVNADSSGYVSLSSIVSAGGTFETWVGSDTVYVTKVYNQTGGIDAIQATQTKQFKIIESGALHTADNGHAAFKVEENLNHMLAAIPRNQPDAIWAKAKVTISSGNRYITEGGSSTGTRRALAWVGTAGFSIIGSTNFSTGHTRDALEHVFYGEFNGASSQAGVDESYYNGNAGTANTSEVTIGNYIGEAAQYAAVGYIQEIILWDGAPSDTERDDVHADIAAFAAITGSEEGGGEAPPIDTRLKGGVRLGPGTRLR